MLDFIDNVNQAFLADRVSFEVVFELRGFDHF